MHLLYESTLQKIRFAVVNIASTGPKVGLETFCQYLSGLKVKDHNILELINVCVTSLKKNIESDTVALPDAVRYVQRADAESKGDDETHAGSLGRSANRLRSALFHNAAYIVARNRGRNGGREHSARSSVSPRA